MFYIYVLYLNVFNLCVGCYSAILNCPDQMVRRLWLVCTFVHMQQSPVFSCLGPEVIKLFSCSTQQSTKYILLINVKMPTIVGILTFISMINAYMRVLYKKLLICLYFSFYKRMKIHAQSS